MTAMKAGEPAGKHPTRPAHSAVVDIGGRVIAQVVDDLLDRKSLPGHLLTPFLAGPRH